jgi:CBS domain-containing membrane protein
MNFPAFIKSFSPYKNASPLSEKLRSGLAGGLAIFLLAWALYTLPQQTYPLLMLGSMAASAVLLFAAPHSPFAQPWNLVGGHLVSALAGWGASLIIPDPSLAAGVAVGTAIFLMHTLNCLHPPGAATALTLILASNQFHSMGWQWVALIIIANAFISLLLALLINNVLPSRRYPTQALTPTPAKLEPVVTPEALDIAWALEQMDGVIDVSVEDLADIFAKAQSHARDRLDTQLKKRVR